MDKNELSHYGTLGMKWGVRRGNVRSAYSKGVHKLKKLDKKASSFKTKSDQTEAKSARVYARGKNDGRARRIHADAMNLNYRSIKLQNKGKKFYKKMEKEFMNIPSSKLNKSDLEYAKRYANSVLH